MKSLALLLVLTGCATHSVERVCTVKCEDCDARVIEMECTTDKDTKVHEVSE